MTTAITDLPRFELLGELPSGRTILEASAGTGKTYAIAGLATRYVIEQGIPLTQLLVVTFTRAATAELRERVRSRLVEAASHLGQVRAGGSPDHADPFVGHLCRGADGRPLSADELAIRHARASEAIADFDAATISTIHGFCQHVLRTLGLTVEVDRDAQVVEDQSAVLTAVVDDLLVQASIDHSTSGIPRRDLLQVAQKVIGNPDARIEPTPGTDTDAALRAELAHRIRDVLAERKRERRLLSYDDLLTRLRDALEDPRHGEAAAAALRSRYRVALIDEFQDTDPVQWDILERAFRADDATLVLIGDPKQAIYSFRGADVHAYLEAVEHAGTKQTLSVNWRSDGPLLDALDALLTGATFGDARIAYRTVDPAPSHHQARLLGAPIPQPLRLRRVLRAHGMREWRGDINVSAAREHIATDLAAQAVELLTSGARITAGSDPSAADARTVGAGDIAVLVRTNAEAVTVHRALREAQVPAIINGVGSVFDTPAASEWLRLLEALERPSNASRARAAALTSFLGRSGDWLASADEEAIGELHQQLHEWAAVLRDRGVASLVRAITVATGLPARLLGVRGGERHLTDLEHLGHLLHAAAISDDLGPSALTSWLTTMIAEVDDEQVPAEERARRLESDDRAVQILTVHRSKGLQYPIVFAPYLWSPGWLAPPVPAFHEDGTRTLDVGGPRDDDPAWQEHRDRSQEEICGESLRLLYVALTRAEHQVVVWWSPCQNAAKSGLGRVLFARDEDGNLDTASVGDVSDDDRCLELLTAIAARAGGTISVEATPRHPQPGIYEPPSDEHGELRPARLERDLDRAWHRTSYSRLTSAAHEPLVTSEPADELITDEDLLPVTVTAAGDDGTAASDEASLRDVALPLGDVPGGTAFGTFVHAILEDVDFTSPQLADDLSELIADQQRWRRTPIGDVPTLVDGLVRAIETPLGPLANGLRLRDISAADRLNELDFELPLDPRLRGGATVARIGGLLREHLPDDDLLAGYAERLRSPSFHLDLRGYLAGSIDLVVRITADDGRSRFVVADHKTNRLGTWGQPLTAWDYRPAAMADAMQRGHYPLQALLYQVALHRYLRWRVAGYDPGAHLGGALYLFVRGMVGADTPDVDGQPCGVFAWQPPAELVVATSDLLDGGAT